MRHSFDAAWGPTRGAWDPGGGSQSAGAHAAAEQLPPPGPRPTDGLVRSDTLSPLLPCGLTEEELAAITAAADSRSASGELAAAEGHPFLRAGRTPRGSPPRLSAPAAGAGTILPARPRELPASLAAALPATPPRHAPAQPLAGRRPPDDPRRSFERVNRVAAAVAAEKARRRSLERQRRHEAGVSRPRSHQHQLGNAVQPRAAAPPSRHAGGQPPLLLLGRQRSASEGQLDVLLGPPTPRESVEGVSAAARLALISPDTSAHTADPAQPFAVGASAQHDAHGAKHSTAQAGFLHSGLPGRQAGRCAEPEPVRSSAPPSDADAAWRDQLRHRLLLSDVRSRGGPGSEGASSSSSCASDPASPFGQRGQHSSDPELQDAVWGFAEGLPSRLSAHSAMAGQGMAPQPIPGHPPGNFTSSLAAVATPGSKGSKHGGAAATLEAHNEPGGPQTPRRKGGLLTAMQRVLRL